MFIRFLIILLVFFSSCVFAQSAKDTVVFNQSLRNVSRLLDSNTDSARVTILSVLNETRDHKYAWGYSKSLSLLAQYYFLKGINDSALLQMPEALKYARISKDTNHIILTYLQYGRLQAVSGRFAQAIDQCLAAQNLADRKKDNTCEIKIKHDLGYVYSSMGLHEKAIFYFRLAMDYARKKQDTFNLANNTARIGGEFNNLSQYDSALYYGERGLELFRRIGHKRGVGATLTNLNASYGGLKNYAAQMEIIQEALKIRSELGDHYALAMLRVMLAGCYLNMRDYNAAFRTASELEQDPFIQQSFDWRLQNYWVQYQSLMNLQRHRDALIYSEKYIRLKDSVYSSTKLKDISELQTRYETDKKEKEIRLLQLERKSEEERRVSENRHRNLILAAVATVAIVIAVFTVLLYRRFRKTNEQNAIIEKQKQLVDEKNQEIIDSINYARTIQQALIPTEHEVQSSFKDGFVIFRPRSIVSGDFYWCSQTEDHFFLVVADCTGHGVPGAFMSMMGISFLNELINERGIVQPSVILNELREKVIASLNKDSADADKQDGMDMVLLRFDLKNRQLVFSGANNSAYHFSGGELNEIRGDKMPAGLYYGKKLPFSERTVVLQPGDRIFACTDGLPDQFGGPRNKKFMYRRVVGLFSEAQVPGMQEMKLRITTALDTWQGQNEQIDDITCLGIEI